MSGRELFNLLVENSGLPEQYVRERFEILIREKGGSIDELSLDAVRDILSDFLLDLIQESHQPESFN